MLHRRLFALSTCRTAVSTLPSWHTQRHQRIIAKSNWTFRFCSVANALALLHHGATILHVGGVSSDPANSWVRKPHTNAPAQEPIGEGAIKISLSYGPFIFGFRGRSFFDASGKNTLSFLQLWRFQSGHHLKDIWRPWSYNGLGNFSGVLWSRHRS